MRISDWSSDVCSSDLSITYPNRLMRIVRRRERFQQPMTIHIASLEVITVGGIRPVEARDAGSLCAGLLYRREIASVIDGMAIDEGFPTCKTDRKSIVEGKSGSVRGESSGVPHLKKK